MDVQPSEEQEILQGTVRDFLARECPMSFVRDMMDDPRGFTDGFWKRLAELGLPGLVVPERHGGAGLGPLDLALVLEEMGAALAPGPFLSSVAWGARAVELAGTPDQQARWLPELAAGRRRATVAWREPDGGWGREDVTLVARREAGGFRLSGAKAFVPDGHTADWIVVAARRERADGPLGLFVVEAGAPGLRVRPVAYTDATRRVTELRLEDVRLPDDAALGEAEDAGPAAERWLDHARVSLCAEMGGLAQRVLDLSVAYAKTREQFGRPIGSFQAIQHRCADMLLQVENVRSAVWYAAWTLGEDEPDAHRAACLAKAYASDACPAVAGAGIQIHGGLGYTWEQDLHLFYKRAKADELALGDAPHHRALAAHTLWD